MDLERINQIAETVLNVVWPFAVMALPIGAALLFNQIKSENSRKLLMVAIDTAYLVVHQVSRKTETKVDDKLSEALKIIKDSLGRDLTEKEKKLAIVKLKAKHEARKFPNLLNIKEVGGFVGGLLGFGDGKKTDY